jgi:hypothetical protein
MHSQIYISYLQATVDYPGANQLWLFPRPPLTMISGKEFGALVKRVWFAVDSSMLGWWCNK